MYVYTRVNKILYAQNVSCFKFRSWLKFWGGFFLFLQGFAAASLPDHPVLILEQKIEHRLGALGLSVNRPHHKEPVLNVGRGVEHVETVQVELFFLFKLHLERLAAEVQ